MIFILTERLIFEGDIFSAVAACAIESHDPNSSFVFSCRFSTLFPVEDATFGLLAFSYSVFFNESP